MNFVYNLIFCNPGSLNIIYFYKKLKLTIMKKEKKSKFDLEKFEVAKLSSSKKKYIVGGLSEPPTVDPTTGTGTKNGGNPSGVDCGGH